MIKSRILATSAAVMVGGLALSGCSTINGLLAPNTEQNSLLQAQATTVVLDNGYKVLEEPLCDKGDGVDVAFSCAGKTQDGEKIDVVVPPFTDEKGTKVTKDVLIGTMTVNVGKKELYSGPIQDVVDLNMYHPGEAPKSSDSKSEEEKDANQADPQPEESE